MSIRFALVTLLGTAVLANGQTAPTNTPPQPPLPEQPTVRIVTPRSANVRTISATPSATAAKAVPAVPPAYRPMQEGLLAWNNETQESTVKPGTPKADFAFSVTNISDQPITITQVRTSCGCTVAKLPPVPWTLEPGTNGLVEVTMNIAGKHGTVIKTITVTSDHGFKTLYARSVIEELPPGAMNESDRLRNLRIASANRQAVFQGECATCHVTPALNKMGSELYDTACAICHGAEHRASMVPDLKNLNKETNADYWRTWITSSMDGKLMPAFALEHGGFLNSMQIDSLVKYLVETMPSGSGSAEASIPAVH